MERIGRCRNEITTDLSEEVYIIGDKSKEYSTGGYLCFAGISDDSNCILHLKDFKFISSHSAGPINNWSNDGGYGKCSGGNITIETSGECLIKSSAGKNAIALEKQNVTFTGSGTLDIYGGDGSNGENGLSIRHTVNVLGGNNRTWYSGDDGGGGNGGSGKDGTQGSNGKDGLNQVRGSAGGAGTDGINGGDGASGAASIKAKSITILNGNVNLQGGAGGIGGSGGTGGKGGTGGIGYAGVIGSAGAGNGGTGGSGGIGGSGGTGGLAVQCEIINISDGKLTLKNGSAGNGGTGGKGGAGGTGGRTTKWVAYCGRPGGGGSGGLRGRTMCTV